MFQNEVENGVFTKRVENGFLQMVRQERNQFAKAFLFIKFWSCDKEMTQNRRWFFHIVIIALLAMIFSGCGYKADPYYEKKEVHS